MTLPSTAYLVSGDHQISIGYISRPSSIVVNWTVAFTESGYFDLNVTVSGYRVGTDVYVERIGYYYSYQVIPEFSGPLQLSIIFLFVTTVVILVFRRYTGKTKKNQSRILFRPTTSEQLSGSSNEYERRERLQ